MTSPRLGSMLPLSSTTRPTVTGMSAFANCEIVLQFAVLIDFEILLGQPGNIATFASFTLTSKSTKPRRRPDGEVSGHPCGLLALVLPQPTADGGDKAPPNIRKTSRRRVIQPPLLCYDSRKARTKANRPKESRPANPTSG